MPFVAEGLSLINASANYTVVFDYNTTGAAADPRPGSFRTFNYDTVDTMAQVMAANYFVSIASQFAPNDMIFVQASDGSIVLEVVTVNVGVPQKFYPPAAAIPAAVTTTPSLGQVVTQTTQISSAEILADVHYALTSTPPAGTKYMHLGTAIEVDFQGDAYTNGPTLTVNYGSTGPVCSSTGAAGILSATADSSAILTPLAVAITAEATLRQALTLVASAQPADGTSVLTVYCTYAIVGS